MDFKTIILKKEEGIATIILNRPERGNATNRQMYNELPVALDEVAKDKEMRVLILTGAGRAFWMWQHFSSTFARQRRNQSSACETWRYPLLPW
jgi:1,4-dihydroxy-2-naphthoyl-CoA synthase